MSQRLLEWNPAALRLVGLRVADRRAQHFQNATTFDLAFGLAQRFVEIENDAAYRRSFVHTLKRELRPYVAEPWCGRCIVAAQQRYPEFKQLWESEHAPETVSLTGRTVPLKLRLSGSASTLTFQSLKSSFVGDARFRIVQWIPVDEVTMHICVTWMRDRR